MHLIDCIPDESLHSKITTPTLVTQLHARSAVTSPPPKKKNFLNLIHFIGINFEE